MHHQDLLRYGSRVGVITEPLFPKLAQQLVVHVLPGNFHGVCELQLIKI